MNSPRPGGPADRSESDRLLDAAHAVTPPVADAAHAAPPPEVDAAHAATPPSAGTDALARLLAAAAAPATGDELDGEERALAAFRAARAAPAAPVAASRPRRRLRVAAALSGLAATTVAGVAFAAVRLDRGPEPPVSPSVSTSTGVGPSGAATSGTGPSEAGPSRPTPSGPPGEASGAVPSPAPSVSAAPTGAPSVPPPVDGKLAGQCRAYLAKPERQRAKALTKPGFADLVATAGGPDRVESYCRAMSPTPTGPAQKESTPKGPSPKETPDEDDGRPGPGDED
ncbi:hypothetical protein O7602_12695 [Micromonospora sp. WMMD1128]|uniref:hypothetical protein n=1 Tax=Micromonospora sp. WMMD1128 TaxID=3015150 RepID=UPI00248CD26B|nr:hypothetical protein [Micromonospora sp. WMMD1128]WBB76329.1 hypothetical protein O7602_12695 [Micromonospora sp. WMMD1128]